MAAPESGSTFPAQACSGLSVGTSGSPTSMSTSARSSTRTTTRDGSAIDIESSRRRTGRNSCARPDRIGGHQRRPRIVVAGPGGVVAFRCRAPQDRQVLHPECRGESPKLLASVLLCLHPCS